MLCHGLSVLSVVTAALLSGAATPRSSPWDDMLIKHKWNTIPDDWVTLGQPPNGTKIDLYIALRPHRENALIDALYEVSVPGHPKYGSYLSREQAAEVVAPHPDTIEVVNAWLAHYGVPPSSISTTHGGGWLTVAGVSLSQANELLGASYQLYYHAETNDTIIRTVGYALPAALHIHVETVVPTTAFTSTRLLQQAPRGLPGGEAASGTHINVVSRSGKVARVPTGFIRPTFLRWLYKTISYEPANGAANNVIGVLGFHGQTPGSEDLRMFMNAYRTSGVDAGFDVVQVNGGGYDPNNPGFEANLDMQISQAITFPARHIFYSVGGEPPPPIPDNNPPTAKEPYLDWLRYILAQDASPTVIIAAYGSYEQTIPRDYATSVCRLFGVLGLRGVSVLFPSGIHGVGQGDCTANDGSGRTRFLPIFPASCPYITSVGGTTEFYPEVAASISGGGFSNYFRRPSYQNDAVSAYLRFLGKHWHAGLYNPEGRGIPDMSAQAINCLSAFKGRIYAINSTSCSVSVVAGVIWLLNDYLIRTNRPHLGFLNPWLYGQHDGPSGFSDIIFGSNPGCGTDGFHTLSGWDPVSGLGTPNFTDLQIRLDKLQW